MIVSTLDRVHGRSTWPPGNWLPPDPCSIMKCGYTLSTNYYLSINDSSLLNRVFVKKGGSG